MKELVELNAVLKRVTTNQDSSIELERFSSCVPCLVLLSSLDSITPTTDSKCFNRYEMKDLFSGPAVIGSISSAWYTLSSAKELIHKNGKDPISRSEIKTVFILVKKSEVEQDLLPWLAQESTAVVSHESKPNRDSTEEVSVKESSGKGGCSEIDGEKILSKKSNASRLIGAQNLEADGFAVLEGTLKPEAIGKAQFGEKLVDVKLAKDFRDEVTEGSELRLLSVERDADSNALLYSVRAKTLLDYFEDHQDEYYLCSIDRAHFNEVAEKIQKSINNKKNRGFTKQKIFRAVLAAFAIGSGLALPITYAFSFSQAYAAISLVFLAFVFVNFYFSKPWHMARLFDSWDEDFPDKDISELLGQRGTQLNTFFKKSASSYFIALIFSSLFSICLLGCFVPMNQSILVVCVASLSCVMLFMTVCPHAQALFNKLCSGGSRSDCEHSQRNEASLSDTEFEVEFILNHLHSLRLRDIDNSSRVDSVRNSFNYHAGSFNPSTMWVGGDSQQSAETGGSSLRPYTRFALTNSNGV